MKILVTGALGFVGSNLAVLFSKDVKNEVTAVDNRSKILGSDQNLKVITAAGAIFKYVDIRNQNDVEQLFQENHFDVILHMAAQVAFKVSVETPRIDFEINALGTFNLLEATRTYSKNAIFVYASTNQVYGALEHVNMVETAKRFDFEDLSNGVPEEFPLDFLSPYGCSKGAAEMYVRDYARVYDMNTVVTRFGGIYGTGQYSYVDHGWVSFICEMVLNDKAFKRFGHGKQVRDILFITDIESAILKVIQRIDHVKGEAINIAGGKDNSISVLELLDILERLTGNKEKSQMQPMRKADKLVMYLDISKAEKLLKWKPAVDKQTGLKKMLEWLANK
ncbi:GDP-mannose 4,6-dehydratase [Paracoccaceae bacterium]|nr:GDP-mannose 4,6-dehydratase [Paracoccaceae bacterium]